MVKLNKNQIKSVVRYWAEEGPLKQLKASQKCLISELKDNINNLVEVNNKIHKIEEKAFNHVSESESESESESDSESNIKNEKCVHRPNKDQLKCLAKLKPGDMLNGFNV